MVEKFIQCRNELCAWPFVETNATQCPYCGAYVHDKNYGHLYPFELERKKVEDAAEVGDAAERKAKKKRRGTMSDAFISYRRKPSFPLAMLIHKQLEDKHHLDAYLDVTRDDGAVQFPERLLGAIADTRVFVCVLADTTLESPWVLKEIEHAYQLRKPCVPVFQESFQESFQEPSEASDAVHYLLNFDAVPVMDQKGLFAEESITKIAKRITLSDPQRRLPIVLIAAAAVIALIFVVLVFGGGGGGGAPTSEPPTRTPTVPTAIRTPTAPAAASPLTTPPPYSRLLRLEGHTAWVASAAYSPDGTRIVTASADDTAIVWWVGE